MNCDDARRAIVEESESGELPEHLKGCEACRSVREQVALVASAFDRAPRPSLSEARVRRAVASVRPRIVYRWAMAAAAALVAAWLVWPSALPEPPAAGRLLQCHDDTLVAHDAPEAFTAVCARSTFYTDIESLQREVRIGLMVPLRLPEGMAFERGHPTEGRWGAHLFFRSARAQVSLAVVRAEPTEASVFQVFPLGGGRTRVLVVWYEAPCWFAVIADGLTVEQTRALVESVGPASGS